MAELLLIEPDENRKNRMVHALKGAGHNCTPCAGIAEGLVQLEHGLHTMTILNTRLPWTESAPFLRLLEQNGLPVLFVTADAGNAAHLKALYRSDCDVILRDEDDRTLLNAVERLLNTSPAVLTRGRLSLNMETHHVSVDNRDEALTEQEYALLYALMQSNQAVSRDELLRTAWGYQSMGITRTVDVHVQRLRRKLGSQFIETVYKTGYKLQTT